MAYLGSMIGSFVLPFVFLFLLFFSDHKSSRIIGFIVLLCITGAFAYRLFNYDANTILVMRFLFYCAMCFAYFLFLLNIEIPDDEDDTNNKKIKKLKKEKKQLLKQQEVENLQKEVDELKGNSNAEL